MCGPEQDDRTIEEKIECILDTFDFERVRTAMGALQWGWYCTGMIPTVNEMRKTAKRLLDLVANEPNDDVPCWHSGGFWATRYEQSFLLQFVIEYKNSIRCQD